MKTVIFIILVATNIGDIHCQACAKSNCKQTTGDLTVNYSSLTKTVNSGVSGKSWSYSTVDVTGKKYIYIYNTVKSYLKNRHGIKLK